MMDTGFTGNSCRPIIPKFVSVPPFSLSLSPPLLPSIASSGSCCHCYAESSVNYPRLLCYFSDSSSVTSALHHHHLSFIALTLFFISVLVLVVLSCTCSSTLFLFVTCPSVPFCSPFPAFSSSIRCFEYSFCYSSILRIAFVHYYLFQFPWSFSASRVSLCFSHVLLFSYFFRSLLFRPTLLSLLFCFMSSLFVAASSFFILYCFSHCSFSFPCALSSSSLSNFFLFPFLLFHSYVN